MTVGIANSSQVQIISYVDNESKKVVKTELGGFNMKKLMFRKNLTQTFLLIQVFGLSPEAIPYGRSGWR